ncbi:MAG: Ig-like domain-containing protein [Candidatus Brocadiaceae bacterium]|uniref:Ig-like domain-containing protein n=1 Tax=Candidatus Wunengus sp. YC61 TaxID=3367698 RepID=UPI002717B6F9|nr:Ig-like domain-containing protein [Candidatus Brocadiaceae bacterium]
MKLVNRKSMFFYIMCIGIIFMNSCAQTPPYEEAIKIIVTPHKLSVCSGSEDTIFVKLLDKQGGPLFGMEVKAISTSPTVATIAPRALTDATGKATFTVKGISPGNTTIVLSVAGQKATMEVIFIEH